MTQIQRLFVIAIIVSISGMASAQFFPDFIPVEGTLSDIDGNPLDGDIVDLRFSIWTGDETDDTAVELWNESFGGVVVTGGEFSVILGGTSPLDGADFTDMDALWLELQVDEGVPMDRIPFGSLPYAFHASSSDTLGGYTAAELIDAAVGDAVQAGDVTYNNATSGLTGGNVQEAIDELASTMYTIQANYDALLTGHETLQADFDTLQAAHDTLQAAHDTLQATVDGLGAGEVAWANVTERPIWLDDDTVAWDEIDSIPAGFADGTDDGLTAVAWDDIPDIPAGFADGTDDGLTSVSWDDITDTGHIIYDGTDFTFSGLNVHVVNGTDTTDGTVNGLGNLIVGYDEPRPSGSAKTGSHNLVVGAEHNYASYGGLVAGESNALTAPYASIGGGANNVASGVHASVSGGFDNTASGGGSSILGGDWNTASGEFATVSGGFFNSSAGQNAAIHGGQSKETSADYASILGGTVAWDDLTDVPAGFADGTDDGLTAVSWDDIPDIPDGFADGVDDTAATDISWDDIADTDHIIYNGTDFTFSGLNVHVVNGTDTTDGTVNGLGNLIVGYDEGRDLIGQPSDDDKTGSHNLVLGRFNNYSSYGGIVVGSRCEISGEGATVTGGLGNTASGRFSSVSGGLGNTASGFYSWIGGGENNQASGGFSSIPGGSVVGGDGNRASGYRSVVVGGSFNYADEVGDSVFGALSDVCCGLVTSP